MQDFSFFDSPSAGRVWTYGKQCLKNGCDSRAAVLEKDELQIAPYWCSFSCMYRPLTDTRQCVNDCASGVISEDELGVEYCADSCK